MFCLVYQSKANPIFGLLQIQEMLEKARQYNEQNNITGCLLLYNGYFLQYLEGSQIKVLNLFDKIQTDVRHTDIKLLSHGEIPAREFDKWEMAFEYLRSENSQLQYLTLLVSSFVEDKDFSTNLNPSSHTFWKTAKLLLASKKGIKN